MQHVKNVLRCVERCCNVMEEATAMLGSFEEQNTNPVKILGCWQYLEASDRELMRALTLSDTSVQQSCSRFIYFLSCGNALAARMQYVKRQFLECLHFLMSKKGGGFMRTISTSNPLEIEATAKLGQLVSEVGTLVRQFEDSERLFLDRFFALQGALLLSSEEKNIMVMKTHLKHLNTEISYKTFWYNLATSLTNDRETTSGVVTGQTTEDDHAAAAMVSKTVTETWTDLNLMNMSLKGAFAAFACRHEFVAACDFALVLKLLVTKCCSVEELILTAFSLQSYKEVHELPEWETVKEEEHIKVMTSAWLPLLLSKIHSDVLPRHTLLTDGNRTLPYWLSVIFVSLLWNIAFCLWQKGSVKEAYRWLCAIDVERLQIIAEEEEEKNVAMSNMCSPLLQECEQALFDPCINQSDRVTRCLNDDDDDESKKLRVSSQVLPRLNYLLRRVTCLRDICSIMLFCTTPQDVLYFLFQMHSALLLKRGRTTSCDNAASGDGDAPSREEQATDAIAEVLVIVSFVVEFYLARSAVKAMGSKVFPSFLSTTVDTAVRCVCDELICFLSSGNLLGVDDVEQRGVPPSWRAQHTDDTTATRNNHNGAVGFMWLISQALFMTQTFASEFRGSLFFRSALVGNERKATPEKMPPSAVELIKKGLGWPMSFVQNVHDAAQFIMRSIGSSWEDDGVDMETLGESSGASGQLRNSFLLPLQCQVTEVLKTEDGPGMLRFPSMQGVGLPLLSMEEEAQKKKATMTTKAVGGGGAYRNSDDAALRLLFIACRYSEPQSLVSMHLHNSNSDDDGGGLLELVVSELDKAVSILMSELRSRCGTLWLEIWRQQKDLSAGRFCTTELLTALVEGTYLPDMQTSSRGDFSVLSHGADGSSPLDYKCQKKPLLYGGTTISIGVVDKLGESIISHGREDIGGRDDDDNKDDDYDNDDDKATGILELPEPTYIPPLHFDFSAFTSSSTEALWATQQLVNDALRCEKITKNAVSADEEENEPSCKVQALSLLNPKARQLIHEELPFAWQYAPWRVIYSSRFHGYSYATMMSCSQREADASRGEKRLPPMILVLELVKPVGVEPLGDDDKGTLVIGAFFSEPLHLGSRRYYGCSETFVYQLLLPLTSSSPQLRTYRATGANEQFINSSIHTLAIGGGGGCSLFLNETVEHGSTTACATFASPPLTHWQLSSPSSFSYASWSSETAESSAKWSSTVSYTFDVRTTELLVIEDRKSA